MTTKPVACYARGTKALKQDPQASPDVLRRLRGWVKERGCTCEERPTSAS